MQSGLSRVKGIWRAFRFWWKDIRLTNPSAFDILKEFALLFAGALLGYWIQVQTKDSTDLILFGIFILLFFIVHLILLIFRQIRGIANDIHVEYIPRKPDNPGLLNNRVHLFHEMRHRINSAESSIYVVNYFTGKYEEEFSEKDEIIGDEEKRARTRYYNALIRKAKQPGIKYTRILQVDDPMLPIHEIVRSESYHIHFKDMLDLEDNSNANARLCIRPVVRPSTFILIDEKYLLWQINELFFQPANPNALDEKDRGSKTNTRMHGMFMFAGNSNNKLIQSFVSLCKELDEKKARKGRFFEKEDLLKPKETS